MERLSPVYRLPDRPLGRPDLFLRTERAGELYGSRLLREGKCCSAVAGWKIRLTRDWKTLRFYLRASTIRYAGGKENKPGRTELLFQMIGDW